MPALLRRLRTHPTEEDAWELFHTITHQGTVYPVTPKAPFVFELIDARPDTILFMVVYVSLIGRGYWQPHRARERTPPDGAVEDERHRVEAIRAAVVNARPLLERMLNRRSTAVRLNAVPILAHLDAPFVAHRMATEPESTVRAAANFAFLEAGRPEFVGRRATDELERISQALARPDEMPEVLLQTLANPGGPSFPAAWPIDLNLEYDVAEALGRCRDAEVFERVLERFDTLPWTVLPEAAEALLILGDRHRQRRRVVAALATTPTVWVDSLRYVRKEMFSKYGLPNDRASLLAIAQPINH